MMWLIVTKYITWKTLYIKAGTKVSNVSYGSNECSLEETEQIQHEVIQRIFLSTMAWLFLQHLFLYWFFSNRIPANFDAYCFRSKYFQVFVISRSIIVEMWTANPLKTELILFTFLIVLVKHYIFDVLSIWDFKFKIPIFYEFYKYD